MGAMVVSRFHVEDAEGKRVSRFYNTKAPATTCMNRGGYPYIRPRKDTAGWVVIETVFEYARTVTHTPKQPKEKTQ